MSEIALNTEILTALMNCKDVKEVMAFAKTKGIDLNEEQANKVFASTHGEELTDEELDMIVGGRHIAWPGGGTPCGDNNTFN